MNEACFHIVGCDTTGAKKEYSIIDFPNFYVFVNVPGMNLAAYNFCPRCGIDLRKERSKLMPHIETITAEELAKYPTGR